MSEEWASTICQGCHKKFSWRPSYANRAVRRRLCTPCSRATDDGDILNMPPGRAPGIQGKDLDGAVIIKRSGCRMGCLACGLPYSKCDCKRRKP